MIFSYDRAKLVVLASDYREYNERPHVRPSMRNAERSDSEGSNAERSDSEESMPNDRIHDLPRSVNIVLSMWLFKHKYLADGFLSRYKTPFVANGSLHQFGVDVDETFSYATRVGFYHSHCDSSLFICCHGTDIACLSLYVVNIVFIGSSATTLHRVIAFPYQLFSMIDLDSLNYFMGSSVVRSRAEIFLFEEKYAFEVFERVHMPNTCPDVLSHGKLSDQLQQCEPKRKKAKKDVFTVNLYYDGLFTSCPMIYFQGQCKVLTDINFDEMTYVHLLEILKRLVPNGFEKIDMYVDHFGYDIMEMVKWDRNEELRNTRIKAELDSSDDDYHYSDDDLEEMLDLKLACFFWNGQCKVLTDINFDEMTYVHLLEILKRLVPNGFEKVYYCKSGAKLTSISEIKPDQDIVDMLKRMYICFKGVKDGWLARCRKVIGLDGCFLKHTCRGELLTAMGRDANNQMYPIAWAVVRAENADN
ncbi:ribonuclease H-like domain-containing protein [Tanacetum coccineum]